MTADPTHRQQAEALAIRLAVAKLTEPSDPTRLAARCTRLGLAAPDATGALHVPLLGRTLVLRPPDFAATFADSGKPAKSTERLLALHYLCSDAAVAPEGRWITFREFPGGAFYWEPFRARSVLPLLKAIGNGLATLRERLTRFAAVLEPGPTDALTARLVAVGRVEALLVYRPGDDEFPATADLLFDACARRVFCAEDAAALAGRICLGLL